MKSLTTILDIIEVAQKMYPVALGIRKSHTVISFFGVGGKRPTHDLRIGTSLHPNS
jgi:hypothetical protein